MVVLDVGVLLGGNLSVAVMAQTVPAQGIYRCADARQIVMMQSPRGPQSRLWEREQDVTSITRVSQLEIATLRPNRAHQTHYTSSMCRGCLECLLSFLEVRSHTTVHRSSWKRMVCLTAVQIKSWFSSETRRRKTLSKKGAANNVIEAAISACGALGADEEDICVRPHAQEEKEEGESEVSEAGAVQGAADVSGVQERSVDDVARSAAEGRDGDEVLDPSITAEQCQV